MERASRAGVNRVSRTRNDSTNSSRPRVLASLKSLAGTFHRSQPPIEGSKYVSLVEPLMIQHSLLTTMGAFLAVLSPICFAGDADISGLQILQQVEQSARAAGQTNGYTEIRGYALRNERFKREAQMEVRAVHQGLAGVSFAVLKVSGSEDIHRRIFKQLLEGEAKLSRLPAAEVALSNGNYSAELSGTELYKGRRCYVLRIRPRRRSKYLLDGRAWIDVVTHALMKMEGRPTASLSIWVGKPLIIREFEQLGSIWVPVRSRSVASSLFLGTTELTIIHRDQQFLPTPQQVGKADLDPTMYRR
jgi:hypothetical protein